MDFLSSGFNLVLMIVGFGLLIFVHELGHFLAAKWAGIRTEAFAVGMGPVMVAWRKGVGTTLGSTTRQVVARAGKPPGELSEQELTDHGLGETEYSLRWLPIGGFVKMLGQDDMNPTAVSADPRSYNSCPVGKRMVVVSAGVVMNVLLAAVLFVVAFMIGVPLVAPVVGPVDPALPAAEVMPVDAVALGITERGLRPGDKVTHIDGKPAGTFADLKIASAMSKPDQTVNLTVRRRGYEQPLEFPIVPRRDPVSGLLSFGLLPGSSSTLSDDGNEPLLERVLERSGLTAAGVLPGMRLMTAGGAPVDTFEQFRHAVWASGGTPVPTEWSAVDRAGQPTGELVRADVAVEPTYQTLYYPPTETAERQNYERGLLGLVPLVRIREVTSGLNDEVLQAGDVILRVGAVDGPRMAELTQELQRNRRGEVDMIVLRDGQEIALKAQVDRKGMIQIGIEWAWDLPIIARPMTAARPSLLLSERSNVRQTPVADLELFGRTRIDRVGQAPIEDWAGLRAALLEQTRAAAEAGGPASVDVTVTHPTPGAETQTLSLALETEHVADLHALSWDSPLQGYAFQPLQVNRSAEGNPLRAIKMGVEETHKFIILTYLTIDRLIRGSVGVEQLRGPVGIVEIGSKFAEGGFTYLLFFLAMISANLAVLNFLPLPIVDGGLFLFLVYEKFKGRPPPLAFQNAATLVGLFLLGG
jgi:regulator of sigma E protease